MATVNGTEYDHIDIKQGSTTTKHMLKDATARGDIENLKSHHNLQIDSIPGTEQTILFDDEGNVRSITHSANGTAVRTDMFTFGDDTIIEVRTLASGEIMTIMTNTDTLVTTVAYTPAE